MATILRGGEVRDGLAGQEHRLVICRSPGDPAEIEYFFSNPPANIDPAALVPISGTVWPADMMVRSGKIEVEFDYSELGSWLACHHNMLFALIISQKEYESLS